MLTKLEQFNDNLSKGFIAIDSSSFTNISCPRKAFLHWVKKIVPAGGRSPLLFGHLVHELLEWGLKQPSFPSLTEWKEKIESLSNTEDGVNLNNCYDDKRNTTVFRAMMEAYHFNTIAKGVHFTPIVFNGEKMVEKSFSIPLGTINVEGNKITVLWEGKIDVIARHTLSNNICITDHKTTSVLGDKFLDDKMRGPQFHGYLYAANFICTEDPSLGYIEDVLLNVLCSKKTGFEFQLMRFKRPKQQIEEWRLQTLSVLERTMNALAPHLRDNTIPLGDNNHCCPKFGKCEFFQVCEAPVNSREAFLNQPQLYTVSEWSPLNV